MGLRGIGSPGGIVVNRAVVGTPDRERWLRLLVRSALAFTGSDRCAIVVRTDGGHTAVVASAGIDDEQARAFCAPIDGSLDATLQLLVGASSERELVLARLGDKDPLGILALRRIGPASADEERIVNALACLGTVALAGPARPPADEAADEPPPSTRRFRALAENARDVVYRHRLLPPRGFDYVSPSVTELLGYTPDEIYADRSILTRLVHHDDFALLDTLIAGAEAPVVVRCIRKDGAIVWTEHRTTRVLDASGRVAFVDGIARDVSDAQRREEELRRRATELLDSNRKKDAWMAALAHELRNPLAALLAAIESVGPDDDPGLSWRRFRDVAERQLRYMTRLVDDVLEASKVKEGRIQIRRRLVPLTSIVEHARLVIQREIAARQQQLVVSVAPDLAIDADPDRMAQVVINLLDNASKYTPAGGRIVLVGERSADACTIRVRDTGKGIPSDLLPCIFDMFVRAQDPDHPAGLGVGLPLARELVEMHGGMIRAHSDGPGKGSELVVRLPLARAERAPARSGLREAVGRPTALRIVVADDNADLADAIADLLRFGGHEVRVAYDGVEALQVAGSFSPDVVLIDLDLPRMNGFVLADRIRRDAGPDAPMLVAVSARDTSLDPPESGLTTFDQHVSKPLSPGALEAVVAAARDRTPRRKLGAG